MDNTTEKASASIGYSSNNPEPPSIKEDSEQVEENTLRSAAEYDLKEKITPS